MRLLVVSGHFPTRMHPSRGMFVFNTLSALASLSVESKIIAPISFKDCKNEDLESNLLDVAYPKLLRFPAKVFGMNLFKIKQWIFNATCSFALSRNFKDHKFDAVYSHFLFPGGDAALNMAKKVKIPAFVTLGESNFRKWERYYSFSQIQEKLSGFDVLFPNSPSLERMLLDVYKIPSSKIVFIPNGVDTSVFYPMDRIQCRQLLGLPLEKKIVIFVGGFVERKGVLKVLQACQRINPKPGTIFIGSGSIELEDDSILFKGELSHDKLPIYLNSADVFVLPSENEGMPNALLEALACNVPIIASSLDVNQYLLHDNSSSFLLENGGDPLSELAAVIEQINCSQDRSDPPEFKYSLLERANKIKGEIIEQVEGGR